MKLKTLKPFLTILACTWLLALATHALFGIEPRPSGDPTTFDGMARQLLDKGFLGETWNEYRSWRAPGYPTFLAGIYATTGRSPGIVVALQYLMLGFIHCGLYLIARELWEDERSARISAALAIIYGPLYYFAGILYAETLFLTLVTWAFYGTVRILKQEDDRIPILLGLLVGILWGAGVLTRTALMYYPLFALGLIGCTLIVRWRSRNIDSLRTTGKRLAWVLVGLIIVVSPFTVRNYLVHGKFLLLGSYGGYNLYMAQYPLQKKEHWSRIPSEMWPEITESIDRVRHANDEVDQDRILSKMAGDIVKTYPLRFAEKCAIEFLKFFTRSGGYGTGLLRYVSLSQYLAIVGLALFALFRTRNTLALSLFGSYILYFGLIHSVTFSMGRLKEAIAVSLIVLAGRGLSLLWSVLPRRTGASEPSASVVGG
jgi:hypothetical protein